MREPGDLDPQALEHARALPARYYASASCLELDQRAVFACSWQLLAHAAGLERPGDYVVGAVADVPLLVVHGEDGRLRALHNVCRHRAGPLATCDGRGAKRLYCRYHGWSYSLDGRLHHAPDMDGARDFDPATIRLPEARVGGWQGLVFVALSDAVPPLEEVLAGIAAQVGDRSLSQFAFHRRVSYEIACNWKVYVDNYLEGYHVPRVHPALNRMLDYRGYATETARWHSLQYSPLQSEDDLYGRGEALYYFIWPNTMLNILPDRLQTNRVLPLAADRCRVAFDYYYPAGPGDPAARFERDQAFSNQVQREDIEICEQVQRGLASGSYQAGRLNPRREAGVHHFHELLRAAYRASQDGAEERT